MYSRQEYIVLQGQPGLLHGVVPQAVCACPSACLLVPGYLCVFLHAHVLFCVCMCVCLGVGVQTFMLVSLCVCVCLCMCVCVPRRCFLVMYLL